jgi:phage-related protein
MSKDCGLSEAATAVNSQVESAKGEVDGLIANADKGIADAIAGLKNKVSGLTDGIKNKIEAMAPEIPEPDAKLQDEVTSMLESADSPGDMVQKYATMKEKFGGAVDIALF